MSGYEARAAYVTEGAVERRYATFTPFPGTEEELQAEGAPYAGGLGFTGYASTVDDPYPVTDWLGEYQETMCRGAFAKALSDNADVRLLINHEGLPLARTTSGTMNLREDQTGLYVDVPTLGDSPMVQDVVEAMRRGDLDQMSFAFKATRQDWNADYTERFVREVKLIDVSLVTYPANGATSAKLRSAGTMLEPDSRAVVHTAWDGSPGRFTDEEWHNSCLIKGDVNDKSTSHLPVKEPNGDINANGVHAAAARLNQVHAAPSQISEAKSELLSLYKTLGEDAPDSLTRSDDDTAKARRISQLRARGLIL